MKKKITWPEFGPEKCSFQLLVRFFYGCIIFPSLALAWPAIKFLISWWVKNDHIILFAVDWPGQAASYWIINTLMSQWWPINMSEFESRDILDTHKIKWFWDGVENHVLIMYAGFFEIRWFKEQFSILYLAWSYNENCMYPQFGLTAGSCWGQIQQPASGWPGPE